MRALIANGYRMEFKDPAQIAGDMREHNAALEEATLRELVEAIKSWAADQDKHDMAHEHLQELLAAALGAVDRVAHTVWLNPAYKRVVACLKVAQQELELTSMELDQIKEKERIRDMTGAIESFRGEFGWLSNFYSCEVLYDGEWYLSVEHAYQAAKTKDLKVRSQLRSECVTAAQAKRFGVNIELRPDWDDIKLHVMCTVVRSKFENNEELKKKLIATGNTMLIEGNNWGDTYWGKVNGRGKNHLGMILMELRAELQDLEAAP